MTQRVLPILAAFVAMVLVPLQAQAFTLTTDMASRFADSLPAAEALGSELRDQGIGEQLITPEDLLNADEIGPYVMAVGKLREVSGSGYQQLSSLASANGFSGAENWAQVGDRVMLAYLALRSSGEMAQMGAMNEQMLSMMPPQAQAKIRGVMRFAKAVQAVPQADKEAVSPIADRLSQVFDGMARQAGVTGQ